MFAFALGDTGAGVALNFYLARGAGQCNEFSARADCASELGADCAGEQSVRMEQSWYRAGACTECLSLEVHFLMA
jgi:hypothetical protein